MSSRGRRERAPIRRWTNLPRFRVSAAGQMMAGHVSGYIAAPIPAPAGAPAPAARRPAPPPPPAPLITGNVARKPPHTPAPTTDLGEDDWTEF